MRRTREALEARFYRGEGVYDNGRQTAQALAVALNLGPVAARDLMASKLVEAVEATGRHYDCGLVGSKFVYRALSAVGRDDLALAMILNPTEPSMTKWIGQTGTLWEDWTSGFSKCHVMLGDFAAWAMEYVAGLRRPLAPGCSRMLIEPSFVTGLSWARAATETPYGRYSVSWKRLSSGIELEVEVPPGAEAEVRLPEGSTRDVSSGRSHFVIQNKVTSKGDT